MTSTLILVGGIKKFEKGLLLGMLLGRGGGFLGGPDVMIAPPLPEPCAVNSGFYAK